MKWIKEQLAKLRAKFVDDLADLRHRLSVKYAVVVGLLPEAVHLLSEMVIQLGTSVPSAVTQAANELQITLPGWMRAAAAALAFGAIVVRAWKEAKR